MICWTSRPCHVLLRKARKNRQFSHPDVENVVGARCGGHGSGFSSAGR
jgi:hypothetical protein